MSGATDRLGRFGEAFVAAWLGRRGFAILARNWRCHRGEIDLVARHGRTLVFVEVKTRRYTGPWSAQLAVDHRKVRRLRRAAEHYLATDRFRAWRAIRFDVVAISVGAGTTVTEVRHYPDAF
ncbi:MAG: YraN family protein [Planctomycetes bacterium]|nr:YraN family protein [Planctomycetota bacterium]